MTIMRQVLVFDASDIHAESAFWAGMFDGRVLADGDWHNVIDGDDRWVAGVQLAPGHVPPEWPDGVAQQVHLDLHVDDFAAMHQRAVALGARVLQAATEPGVGEGFQVYADPAGHPFCLCWGQPDDDAVRRFVRRTEG